MRLGFFVRYGFMGVDFGGGPFGTDFGFRADVDTLDAVAQALGGTAEELSNAAGQLEVSPDAGASTGEVTGSLVALAAVVYGLVGAVGEVADNTAKSAAAYRAADQTTEESFQKPEDLP